MFHPRYTQPFLQTLVKTLLCYMTKVQMDLGDTRMGLRYKVLEEEE